MKRSTKEIPWHGNLNEEPDLTKPTLWIAEDGCGHCSRVRVIYPNGKALYVYVGSGWFCVGGYRIPCWQREVIYPEKPKRVRQTAEEAVKTMRKYSRDRGLRTYFIGHLDDY